MTSPSIGTALEALRSLSGLRTAEIASYAGVSEQDVRRAEQVGPRRREIDQRLADAYGFDGERLGKRLEAAPDPQGSLFLFSGDLSGMSPWDLPCFDAALAQARRWLHEPDGRRGLKRRLALLPSAPRGPASADAARHGHVLARQTRAALDLRTEPLPELRELLERELGVVVVVHELRTRDLRAGAVLDFDRTAAAIVIGASTRRPALQRVALAHELCHLLYDPALPRRLVLTLDRMGTGNTLELGENRARGFAAELLLPLEGLRDLLGPATASSDPGDAATSVQRAAERYGTSWELTANHLFNLGFISHGCWREIRWRSRELAEPAPMLLPATGREALCLAAATAQHPDEAHSLAQSSRATGARLKRSVQSEVRATVERLVGDQTQAAGRGPMRAGVELAKLFDSALEQGNAELARAALRHVDPQVLHGDAAVLFLSNVRAACEALGGPLADAYRERATATLDALAHRWSWTGDDIVDAQRVLL